MSNNIGLQMQYRLAVTFSVIALTMTSLSAQEKKKQVKKPSGPSIVWVTPESDAYTMPPRTTHKTFESEVAKQKVGYTIYLPPGYETDTEKRYPVIYNLHGNGGNERKGLESQAILHDGITKGWWPPMIMVRPNGGRSTFYKDSADGRFPIETMFINELIPHIDKSYRTIAARHGRCIEGFSMGGRGSTRLAVKYPDLFCSLFCQAGNVPRTSEGYDPTMPDVYPNSYLGKDKQNYIDNDVFLLIEKNKDKIKGRLRILIACGTKDMGHLVTIREFHDALLKLDIDHTYHEIESLKHERVKMMNMLKPVLFDYHVESMRLAKLADQK
jgi:S-formylglutathione hydrolase FrmB